MTLFLMNSQEKCICGGAGDLHRLEGKKEASAAKHYARVPEPAAPGKSRNGGNRNGDLEDRYPVRENLVQPQVLG
jgi:hypothetical protein